MNLYFFPAKFFLLQDRIVDDGLSVEGPKLRKEGDKGKKAIPVVKIRSTVFNTVVVRF